jgi:hypothetical protein
MKRILNCLFVALGLFLLDTSCVKKKEYSDEPEIGYKDFVLNEDGSADMVLTFSDGDGDVGRDPGDATINLYSTYYYKDTITGNFTAFYDQFTLDTTRNNFTVRMPVSDYDGRSITGEIMVHISKYRHSKKIKSLKYVTYLFDNAGHQSNILSTPELTAP